MRRSSPSQARQSSWRSILALAAASILAASTRSDALSLVVDGPEKVLFNQATDACDASDMPDTPARAFRDAQGVMVLFAPNYRNRAFTGPDLDHLIHDCTIRFAASSNADPALLDDRSWLHAFHTDNGRDVFAFATASFIPYRHDIPCAAGTERTDCWYNGLAALHSDDGGATFQYLGTPPRQIAFPPPEPYRSDIANPAGFLTATNIVAWNGSLYTILWRRGGDGETKSHNCLARAPADNVMAWDVWSGSEFVPGAHFDGEGWLTRTSVCGAVGPTTQPNIRGLVLQVRTQTFVAVFEYRSGNSLGFFYATSKDLITWSTPELLLAVDLQAGAHRASWAGYPSIIDDTSPDRNFGSMGETANLVFVRFLPKGQRSVTRQLVTVPIRVED